MRVRARIVILRHVDHETLASALSVVQPPAPLIVQVIELGKLRPAVRTTGVPLSVRAQGKAQDSGSGCCSGSDSGSMGANRPPFKGGRETGIVPSCLRTSIILSSVWFEGNEISVACAQVYENRPATTLRH
jgi:hypothetical protein